MTIPYSTTDQFIVWPLASVSYNIDNEFLTADVNQRQCDEADEKLALLATFPKFLLWLYLFRPRQLD
jgi:hypothetical protein